MLTGTMHKRDLPHIDVPGSSYFVTTCLKGSISAQGFLDLLRCRDQLEPRVLPSQVADRDWDERRWKLNFARADEWLDERPAARHLEDPRLAGIVVDALKHFQDIRYRLLAYVVMPSHFHWAFQPLSEWFDESPPSKLSARSQIIHSINRHTAKLCNELMGRTGAFWQHESYDHRIRDDGELERIIAYIEANPVKAGLIERAEQWRFSSAHRA